MKAQNIWFRRSTSTPNSYYPLPFIPNKKKRVDKSPTSLHSSSWNRNIEMNAWSRRWGTGQTTLNAHRPTMKQNLCGRIERRSAGRFGLALADLVFSSSVKLDSTRSHIAKSSRPLISWRRRRNRCPDGLERSDGSIDWTCSFVWRLAGCVLIESATPRSRWPLLSASTSALASMVGAPWVLQDLSTNFFFQLALHASSESSTKQIIWIQRALLNLVQLVVF